MPLSPDLSFFGENFKTSNYEQNEMFRKCGKIFYPFLELGQLSGVAAILRFPVPDITEDDDDDEDSD